jgi:hypothetical protein
MRIALILILLACGGCSTFKGFCDDASWLIKKTGDNIQTTED